MNSIKLLSPSKINLTLEIIGKREDGYHNIRSVVQPINLFDEIEIELTDQTNHIELLVKGDENVPGGPDNLAYRAAKSFLENSGLTYGVRISLNKKIPSGSGLGGASSNAAAILVGLNRITSGLDFNKERGIALELGADVSLFLNSKTALIEGIGEKVTLLNDFPLFNYVVLCPDFYASTKKIYEMWDSLSIKSNQENSIQDTIGEFKFNETKLPLKNDLEEPFKKLFPKVVELKDLFYSLGAKSVSLTGSGSAVYAVFSDESDAYKIYDYIKVNPEYRVFIAKAISGWHRLV